MIVERFGYSIDYLMPPRPGASHMNGWGFYIRLRADIVKQLVGIQIPEEGRKNLEADALDIIEVAWGKPQMSRLDARVITYYNNTALLEHITVPGNACGLDPSFDSKTPYGLTNLKLAPHNVDCMPQAYSLVSIWLMWFNLVMDLLERP